jgi:exonuclease SbcC
LKLEFSDKQEIVVRDFLNNGQLRNIKTLSGGQTFQASLCLALALADSIHQVHKNEQNFFFLDEGFGTLDKESLYTVFQTLQSLVKENRIIGLISHVEDLQQEIGAYLTIVNDGEKGSLVKRSWEE